MSQASQIICILFCRRRVNLIWKFNSSRATNICSTQPWTRCSRCIILIKVDDNNINTKTNNINNNNINNNSNSNDHNNDDSNTVDALQVAFSIPKNIKALVHSFGNIQFNCCCFHFSGFIFCSTTVATGLIHMIGGNLILVSTYCLLKCEWPQNTQKHFLLQEVLELICWIHLSLIEELLIWI